MRGRREPRRDGTPGTAKVGHGTLSPGSLLGGYRIERLLGQGGMGVVYEATQLSLGRRVAVKVLSTSLAGDGASRQRFLQEGRLAARVAHPNLIMVLEAAEEQGELILAQELVEGGTLAERLHQQGALPLALAMEVVETTASVLITLHAAAILHRDLKPANLFLSPSRGVLVGDLGIAKDRSIGGFRTQAGVLLGTPGYLPPEAWAEGAATPAWDLYSLGVIFFECLTGKRPFEGENLVTIWKAQSTGILPDPGKFREDLPPGLDRVLAGFLAPDPADRFADASAAAAALKGGARGQPGRRDVRNRPGKSPRFGHGQTIVAVGSKPGGRAPSLPGTARVDSSAGGVSAAPVRKPRVWTSWLGLGVAALLVATLLGWAFLPRASFPILGPSDVRPSTPPPEAAGRSSTTPTAAIQQPKASPKPQRGGDPKDPFDVRSSWLVASGLPADESIPEMARLLELIRRSNVNVATSQSRARRNLDQIDPGLHARDTVMLWSLPLRPCLQLLQAVESGDSSLSSGLAAALPRIMAALLLHTTEADDALRYTIMRWGSRRNMIPGPELQLRLDLLLSRVRREFGEKLMPLQRTWEAIAPSPAPVNWAAGETCLLPFVQYAGWTPPAGASAASLIEDALLRSASGEAAVDFPLIHGLIRALRFVATDAAGDAAFTTLRGLLESKQPGSPPSPTRQLALFDLACQRVWLVRPMSQPATGSLELSRREAAVWLAARDRLLREWPWDPRHPPPPGPASELAPDVRLRLQDVRRHLKNAYRSVKEPVPPEPQRNRERRGQSLPGPTPGP